MIAVASQAYPLQSPTSFHRKDAPDGPQQLTRGAGLEEMLKTAPEFVEGSSTGTLTQIESKYPYINSSQTSSTPQSSLPTKTAIDATASPTSSPSTHLLYDRPLSSRWLMPRGTSAGFINTGNTCFLNSVLQCLIHTSPLQHLLKQHGSSIDKCRVSDGFCMACKLRDTTENTFTRDRPFIPTTMVQNLHRIAKHMRRGRQEDAHEFLRYSVDALQRSCLVGYPSKLDPKIAQTTWVHKLFGGRLRSRVTCGSCDHASDTFDAILDLSIDIHGVTSLKQALTKFVQIDHLRGANKYKCERCKKPVNAEKQFTVHDAPMCLTVHLKRFTPLGRKLGHAIDYPHSLDLQPAMSEGQHGPRYGLYGVISHAGGGPNSGHYYAHVKGPDGWYEANDELVTRSSANAVTGRKNAYMLFYMRVPGDALGAAISLNGGDSGKKSVVQVQPYDGDEEEDRGRQSFIGPVRPPSSYLPALTLQEKIAKQEAKAVQPETAAKISLVPCYDGEDDVSSAVSGTRSSPPSQALASSANALTPSSSLSTIPPSSFYGNGNDTQSSKKRKGSGDDDDAGNSSDTKRSRTSPPSQRHVSSGLAVRSGNPFTKSSLSDNLRRDQTSQGQGLSSSFNLPLLQHRRPNIAFVGQPRLGVTQRMKRRMPKGI
ncbi:cysteine proteinase [Hysterangium stoloniferum]|nr:cysteine proteinase [Hysterangium stoloniferum]